MPFAQEPYMYIKHLELAAPTLWTSAAPMDNPAGCPHVTTALRATAVFLF
jgi:hypothetical protein